MTAVHDFWPKPGFGWRYCVVCGRTEPQHQRRCATCDVQLFDDPHVQDDGTQLCDGCCTTCVTLDTVIGRLDGAS